MGSLGREEIVCYASILITLENSFLMFCFHPGFQLMMADLPHALLFCRVCIYMSYSADHLATSAIAG